MTGNFYRPWPDKWGTMLGGHARTAKKFIFSLTLLTMLVPGLIMELKVPKVPVVHYFWSVVEIFLTIKIFELVWPEKAVAPKWFTRLTEISFDQAWRFIVGSWPIVLLFDGLRVAFGLGFFGHPEAPYLDLLNPTWWSLIISTCIMFFLMIRWPVKRWLVVVGLLILLSHQFFLWLGKDIFIARFQLIIYGLLALVGVVKFSERLGVFVLAVALFFVESWFMGLDFYQRIDYPWLDPQVDHLKMAYESFLAEIAVFTSGQWGFGLAYWPKLDLLREGALNVNSLIYMCVWMGVYGTYLYLMINILFHVFLFKTLAKRFPFGWLNTLAQFTNFLLMLNILFNSLATMGFLGGHDPVGIPFVGSNQVGTLTLGLTYLAMAGRKYLTRLPELDKVSTPSV
ncbi:MAG: hypothetical protein LBT86_10715 [Deltaproteobacteria bacterium]|jgi:hypothetical protein|nr:hypothetical protein [Deltaproteobacteria bacterium]